MIQKQVGGSGLEHSPGEADVRSPGETRDTSAAPFAPRPDAPLTLKPASQTLFFCRLQVLRRAGGRSRYAEDAEPGVDERPRRLSTVDDGVAFAPSSTRWIFRLAGPVHQTGGCSTFHRPRLLS